MKIPLGFKFTTLDGQFFTLSGNPPDPENPKDHVTMRHVCMFALTQEFPEDTQAGKDFVSNKLNQFLLTQVFMQAAAEAEGFVEITAEQALLLKQRIGRLYPVLVAAPAFLILDGKEPPK